MAPLGPPPQQRQQWQRQQRRQQQQGQQQQRWRRRRGALPRAHTAAHGATSATTLVAVVAAAVLLAVAGTLSGAEARPLVNTRPGNVLTLILTDCARYQDWQTIAAAFAWRQSGQPGSVVRVANCNDEDTKAYDERMLKYVDTRMVPQYAWNERLKDWYSAYNKPGAVLEYLRHNSPKEEWVVVLDSDMLLRVPFVPSDYNLTRGWAMAAFYDYLKGTDNELALRHVPDIAPRNDTLAGRAGRRGDRVGGPYFMHRDDLARVAPLWYNYTVEMRTDYEAYKDSGDTASKKGDRIWIAEMYGYSFGAAKAGVWHRTADDFMLYPTYTPSTVPHVLHYGLIYTVAGWTYDKHWYFDFDARSCPPWDLDVERPKGGVFPPPPHPNNLTRKDYLSRYTELLAVSVITTVNAGLCDFHARHCPASRQLSGVCNRAFALYHTVDQEIRDIEWRWNCADHNAECKFWAGRGECNSSRDYMRDHCRPSCGYCSPPGARPRGPEDELLTVELIQKEAGVAPLEAAEVAKAAEEEAARLARPKGSKGSKGKEGKEGGGGKKKEGEKEQEGGKQKEGGGSGGGGGGKAAGKADGAKAAAAAAGGGEEAEGGGDGGEGEDDAEATSVLEHGRLKKGGGKAQQQQQQQGQQTQQQGQQQQRRARPRPLKASEEMRALYPASTLSYAALVKRCADLLVLTDEGELRDCVAAAGLKLAYPGRVLLPDGGGNAAGGGGGGGAGGLVGAATAEVERLRAAAGNAAQVAAATGAQDLAQLHALALAGRDKYHDLLGRRMAGADGALSVAEQLALLAAAVAAGVMVRRAVLRARAARRAAKALAPDRHTE